MERFGDLPNEFDDGTCATFQFPSGDERVMFCFPTSGKKKCFRYVKYFYQGYFNMSKVSMEKVISIIPTQATITTTVVSLAILKTMSL